MIDINGKNRSITIATIENFTNPEGFPTLRITYNCEGYERHEYLMPIKLCKFQVCGYWEDQSFGGTCEDVGLVNILRADDYRADPNPMYQSDDKMRRTAVECLYGLALSELNYFCQGNNIFIDMPRHFHNLKNGNRIHCDIVKKWLYDEVVPYIEEHTDI